MTLIEWAEAEIALNSRAYGFDPDKESSQLFQLHKDHGEHIPLECYFQAYGRVQAYKRLISNLKNGVFTR